ncbi:MAG: hypothetical protein MJ179_06965 [Treponema sp.]|nr:hypothetical protein [Treponema sp.]
MKKVLSFIIFAIMSACTAFGVGLASVNNPKFGKCSVEVFEGTFVYEFAKLVDKQNVSEIKKQYSNYEKLIGTVESTGTDNNHVHLKLLHWAVGNKKYKALKTLLELGADPNVLISYEDQFSNYDISPLYMAVFNSRNYGLDEGSKYIELLLKYGADADLGRSCLWVFAGTDYAGDLKKIKLLVEKGKADVNTSSSNGGEPFFLDKLYGANKNLAIAKYLIVDCKADLTKKFTISYKSEVKEKYNTPAKLIEYLPTVDGYKNDKNFKSIYSYMLEATQE